MSEALEGAWVGLLRVPGEVLGCVEAQVKRAGFPGLDRYEVLLMLDKHSSGRLRQRDLGAMLVVAKYNLSRLLDRLEKDGLVRREQCPSDLRGQDVVITDAGRALRRATWPAYLKAVRERVGARLSEGEQVQLAELLGKLV